MATEGASPPSNGVSHHPGFTGFKTLERGKQRGQGNKKAVFPLTSPPSAQNVPGAQPLRWSHVVKGKPLMGTGAEQTAALAKNQWPTPAESRAQPHRSPVETRVHAGHGEPMTIRRIGPPARSSSVKESEAAAAATGSTVDERTDSLLEQSKPRHGKGKPVDIQGRHAIRGSGMCAAMQRLELKEESAHSLYDVKAVPVGRLGDKWRLPTDHLPVEIEVDGCAFVSWNVMNAKSICKWCIELDSQGLKGSPITALHHLHQYDEGFLTAREKEILRLLGGMMLNPGHPKRVISLQECSSEFIQALRFILPGNMSLLLSASEECPDQVVMIYDHDYFECVRPVPVFGETIFSERPDNKVMKVILRERMSKQRVRKEYCFVNVHVPGDPKLKARQELIEYLFLMLGRANMTVIAMGDLNFVREEMKRLADEQSRKQGYKTNPFKTIAPYRTNVGSDFSRPEISEGKWPLCAKAVDMFLVDESHGARVKQTDPEGIFSRPDHQLVTDALRLFVPAQ